MSKPPRTVLGEPAVDCWRRALSVKPPTNDALESKVKALKFKFKRSKVPQKVCPPNKVQFCLTFAVATFVGRQ